MEWRAEGTSGDSRNGMQDIQGIIVGPNQFLSHEPNSEVETCGRRIYGIAQFIYTSVPGGCGDPPSKIP